MSKTKVLLVDDEVEFATALAERLRLRAYDTKAVFRAEDALSMIQHDRPDVILLDCRMPGMDGIEALQKIKLIDPSIEVIMVTGIEDSQIIEEEKKGNIFEYVIKPLDINNLIVKIDQAKKKRSVE